MRITAQIISRSRFRRCVAVLLVLALAVTVSAAGGFGDVNGDGTVNLKDVTLLRRELAAGEVVPDTGNPDANGDGAVNLKDVTFLQRYLAGGWGVELPTETEPAAQPLPGDLAHYEVLSTDTSEDGITATSFRYGQSVRQRDLVCWSIHPEAFSRTVLLNFEIHGWEDTYAADGQLLVDLGNALVEHYAQSADLHGCRLLLIPSANPDGLAEGYTQDGPGRCNYDGVDLNRDFDANHTVNPVGRNYTPYPFSAPESRALRDLVWAAAPDVVVDFHGWLNYTIGDSDLAEVFSLHTGLHQKNELGTGASGYFAYWAQLQGAEAILVEFKDTESIVTADVIAAVDRLVTDNYGSRQHDYEPDETFADFGGFEAFTLSDGRVYTHKQVGDTGTGYGYISGGVDKCTVSQVYANGWCKVRYPSGSLTKTGYCEFSAFVDPAARIEAYSFYPAATVNVYDSADLTNKIGSAWTTDRITVIAKQANSLQILYPLDAGGFRLGWIEQP